MTDSLVRPITKFFGQRRSAWMMVAPTIIALSQLLFISPAQAKITIVSIVNASAVEDLTTETPKVYGGTAGSLSRGDCASLSADSTCDNCVNSNLPGDNDNLVACNNNRIHPTLILKITLSSDAVDSGKLSITTNSDSTSGNPTKLTLESSTPVSVSKGQTATIYVTWKEICDKIASTSSSGGHTNCVPSGGSMNNTLRVGVDGNNDGWLDNTADDFKRISFTVQSNIGQDDSDVSVAKPCSNTDASGICFFKMGSGDTKAVIRQIEPASGFPNGPNIQFKYIRLFYESSGNSDDPTTLQRINPTSPYQDLAVSTGSDGSTSYSPTKVSDLANDEVYYFKVAVVDAAGNVGYYTPYDDDDYCDLDNESVRDTSCHKAVPGEVVGVLESNNCFIATAAYGSPMASQVETFRQFRSRYLLKTMWGKAFVRFYYENSPPIANFIAQSETLRAVSRLALWPLLAFSWLSLEIGAAATCWLLATLLLLPILYRRVLRSTATPIRRTRG